MTRVEPRQIGIQIIALLLVALAAVADNLTGPVLTLSILYLGPISLAAWYLPRVAAWLNALASGVACYLADLHVGYVIPREIAFANAVLRTTIFVVVVLLLQRLRRELATRRQLIDELQKALADVRTLSGLIPICAWCKQVRDDAGYWRKLEAFLQERTDARVTHGICPACAGELAERSPPSTEPP